MSVDALLARLSGKVPGWIPALACALAALAAAAQPAPESATGWTPKQPAYGTRFMVAAAHPLAAEAGAVMLRRGGSAVDAAIAASLVLGLVEPESSGIGGGGFLLHYTARDQAIATYDGRETAPAGAVPELFLDQDGQPLDFLDAVVGGRSVGVPGLVRLYEIAHARHGRLDWTALFQPAIRLARAGFPVSQRLARHIAGDARLRQQPSARAYFFHADGTPREAGETVRNPALAEVLEAIARAGAQAFYAGPIARDIAAAVRGHAGNPGNLAEADLTAYRVRVREPVCGPYRVYVVCGMGPPSSGGIAVLQMRGILARFEVGAQPFPTAPTVHAFAEAGRLAYADRAHWVADPDFFAVPVAGLLAPAYLAARSALIGPRSMVSAAPGEPQAVERAAAADDALEWPATSHLVVVDADGNAVSLTQSIEYGFGSHLMVRGFLLNNELTDFAFTPVQNGLPVANRVQPGKRPRSSMAPVLVLDGERRLVGALGAPGGSAIINYVAKMLVALIDGRLDLQAAIDLGNFGSRNGPTELEAGRRLDRLEAPLAALGHPVHVIELNSGGHAIWRTGRGWTGAADPRREGAARGE